MTIADLQQQLDDERRARQDDRVEHEREMRQAQDERGILVNRIAQLEAILRVVRVALEQAEPPR